MPRSRTCWPEPSPGAAAPCEISPARMGKRVIFKPKPWFTPDKDRLAGSVQRRSNPCAKVSVQPFIAPTARSFSHQKLTRCYIKSTHGENLGTSFNEQFDHHSTWRREFALQLKLLTEWLKDHELLDA